MVATTTRKEVILVKFLDAAGSRWVTPSWVAKARIKELQQSTKEDSNERDSEKK